MSFQKFSGGNTPGLPQREGATPSRTTPSPASGRARGASAPVLGPKLWFPQLFSRGCAPVNETHCIDCSVLNPAKYNWLR